MRHFRRKPTRDVQKRMSKIAGRTCGPSRKIMFPSHEAALTRAGEIITKDPTAKLKRAYKCQYCGNYHLTSQP